jgi:palmitoyltransferase
MFLKFFVNFLQWAAILGFWMFATLLGLNIEPRTSAAPELDAQQIVVIALFVDVVPNSYLPP